MLLYNNKRTSQLEMKSDLLCLSNHRLFPGTLRIGATLYNVSTYGLDIPGGGKGVLGLKQPCAHNRVIEELQ